MQAALGKSQLLRMTSVTEEKRRIGLRYHEQLSNHPLVQLQPTETSYARNMYWVVGVILDETFDVPHIARLLRENGVDTRPFFFPLHRQPVLAKYSLSKQPSLPISERLGAQGLYLPSFIGLSNEDISFCVDQLVTVLQDPQQ